MEQQGDVGAGHHSSTRSCPPALAILIDILAEPSITFDGSALGADAAAQIALEGIEVARFLLSQPQVYAHLREHDDPDKEVSAASSDELVEIRNHLAGLRVKVVYNNDLQDSSARSDFPDTAVATSSDRADYAITDAGVLNLNPTYFRQDPGANNVQRDAYELSSSLYPTLHSFISFFRSGRSSFWPSRLSTRSAIGNCRSGDLSIPRRSSILLFLVPMHVTAEKIESGLSMSLIFLSP